MKPMSKHEVTFLKLWGQVSDLQLLYAYKDRGIMGKRSPYEFDFWVMHTDVLIEINGGIWMGKSAHAGGTSLRRDYDKLMKATLAGYNLFMLDTSKLTIETLQEIHEYATKQLCA
jgi:hypothetical protein